MRRAGIRKSTRASLAAIMLALVLIIAAVGAAPAAAETDIPQDATIDSATLWIYSEWVNGGTVDLHRATADWAELTVTWNSFGGSFAPDVAASFDAITAGWYAVDVTALVEGWLDGTYPNYGILLKQADEFTVHRSSDYGIAAYRPRLEISYTLEGNPYSVTIVRGETDDVADAYISEGYPDDNYGSNTGLTTGTPYDHEKQSLIRFDVSRESPPEQPVPGVTGWGAIAGVMVLAAGAVVLLLRRRRDAISPLA